MFLLGCLALAGGYLSLHGPLHIEHVMGVLGYLVGAVDLGIWAARKVSS